MKELRLFMVVDGIVVINFSELSEATNHLMMDQSVRVQY